MGGWLIDETRLPDPSVLAEAAESAVTMRGRRRPAVAIRVNDVVVHDTRKWFSGADIRLDTIVIRGTPETDGQQDFYQPTTFRFSDIEDGDRLPIDTPGLLVFYGQPVHFLDISVLVSRDRRDSADLGQLIAERLNSQEWKSAAASLLGLAVAAPPVAAITAAIGGAAVLANVAAEILRSVTGDTIGLYRVSWLQHRDRFGIGRHPETGAYRQRDLSFWYEIVLDKASRGDG